MGSTLILPVYITPSVELPAVPVDCANRSQCGGEFEAFLLLAFDDGTLTWTQVFEPGSPQIGCFQSYEDAYNAGQTAAIQSAEAGNTDIVGWTVVSNLDVATDPRCSQNNTGCAAGTLYDPLREACAPACPAGYRVGTLGGGITQCLPITPVTCPPGLALQFVNGALSCGPLDPTACPPGKVFDPKTNTCIKKPGAACPPPGIIALVNGVPVCMMDPPLPSPTPMLTPFKAWSPLPTSPPRLAVPGVRPPFSPAFLALDPTRRRGIPFIMKHCDCNGQGEDFTGEELTA